MHTITFYPLGNAESCSIELNNGRMLLFDYANVRDPNDPGDLRFDLAKGLREKLRGARRDDFDLVAFTHLDMDHIQGVSEFFYLRHAKKYQDANRIKIATLCVPAAAIIEDGCEDEARILRAEARYRLREGSGIRVISRPQQLASWLEKQGVHIEDRLHLISEAGTLLPEFTLSSDGVEFFVHSPFASRLADGSLLDRNTDALVMQARFEYDLVRTHLLITADVPHDALAEMIRVTKWHKNQNRLEWDIMDIPHHCSYLSLAAEKGKDKTEPDDEIKWLFEDQAQQRGVLVSSSQPIPENDDDPQPPHRQAANYYRECADAIDGEFKVTMEHPKKSSPEPLVITIDGSKATVKKPGPNAVGIIASRPSPRAG